MLDGLKGLQGIRSSILTAKNSAFVSALADMFTGRDGAVVEISPLTCFTDIAGTIPAEVGDQPAYMTNLIDPANPCIWPVPGDRPFLRQDDDGNYYLEMGSDAHIGDFLALTHTGSTVGALVVADREGPASSRWTSMLSATGSATAFGLGKLGSSSANIAGGGKIYIDESLTDLEADGTTLDQMFTALQGLHVVSGVDRGTAPVDEEFSFYGYQTFPTIPGKFYGAVAIIDMTEAERVAAVDLMMAQFNIEIVATVLDSTQMVLGAAGTDRVAVHLREAIAGGTDLQYREAGDADWISLGSPTVGTHWVTGLTDETVYAFEFRVVGGAEQVGEKFYAHTMPADPEGILVAFDPTIDRGVTGDLFVDGFAGDDANDGSTLALAVATLTRAGALAAVNDKVKVRAYPYREKLTADFANGVTFEGYADEKFTIDAAEPITGLTVASGVTGTGGETVYEVLIPKAEIEHDGFDAAMSIYQGAKRYEIATDRANNDDLFNSTDHATYHLADTFGLGGGTGDVVQSITDADRINDTNYTVAGLLGATVKFRAHPNRTASQTVTAVNLATNTITVDGSARVQGFTSTPDPDDLRFAITNVLEAISPGTFFAEEDGTDVRVYICPIDADDTDGFTYSSREHVIELDSADDPTFRDCLLYRPTGTSGASSTGYCVYRSASATGQGATFNNFCTVGSRNTGSVSRGFYIKGDLDNLYVDKWSTLEHEGQHGIGTGGGDREATQWYFTNIIGSRTGLSVLGGYHFDHLVIAHYFFKDSGLGAHSSIHAFYGTPNNDGTDHILLWDGRYQECNGALNIQQTSNFFAGFIRNPVYETQFFAQTTIADTNVSVWSVGATYDYAPVEPQSEMILFNCDLPAQEGNEVVNTAISMVNDAAGNFGLRHQVYNCVSHGISAVKKAPTSREPDMANNIHTRISAVGTTWPDDFFLSNHRELDLSLIYEDYEAYDYDPPSGSIVLSKPGIDLRGLVTDLQAEFPGLTDWTVMGVTLDWDDLPMGFDPRVTWVRTGLEPTEISMSKPTTTTADVSIEVNSTTGTFAWGIWADDSPPADEDAVRDGTGAVWWEEDLTPTVGTKTSTGVTGIPVDIPSRLYAVQYDGSTSSGVQQTLSERVPEAVLGIPAISAITATTATATISTDGQKGIISIAVFPSTEPNTDAGGLVRTPLDPDISTVWHTELKDEAGPNIIANLTGLVDGTEYIVSAVTESGTVVESAAFTAAGAGGSPELVTDSDFDDDTLWDIATGATISGGVLDITTSMASFSSVVQKVSEEFSVVNGTDYIVEIDVSAVTAGSGRLVVREYSGSLPYAIDESTWAVGVYSETWTADSTGTIRFELWNLSGALDMEITSLSIKEA